MGIDFAAILSHSWPASEILRLPHILNRTVESKLATATDDLYRSLEPTYINIRAEESWQFDRYYHDGVPHPTQWWRDGMSLKVEGPAGMALWIGPHTMVAWNVTRWRTFLTDQTRQNSLRAICQALAMITRASYVIYLPDSGFSISEALDLVDSGKTLDEVRAFLVTHHGPPMPHIADIYERDEGEWRNGNGYFIDHCGL